jgi:hypothetical protein
MDSSSERPSRLKKLKRLPAANNSVMPITGAEDGQQVRATGAAPASVEPDVHDVPAAWAEAGWAGKAGDGFQPEALALEIGKPAALALAHRSGSFVEGAVIKIARSVKVGLARPTESEKIRALDLVQQSMSGAILPLSGTLMFSTRRRIAKYLIVPSGEPSDKGAWGNGVFQNVHLLRLFIEQGWQLPRPDVIITINDGERFLDLKQEEKETIMRGMMDGTRHLKPWSVCAGVGGRFQIAVCQTGVWIKLTDVAGCVAMWVQVCDWWHPLRFDEACRRGSSAVQPDCSAHRLLCSRCCRARLRTTKCACEQRGNERTIARIVSLS